MASNPSQALATAAKYDCYVSCWYASQVLFLHLISHFYFQTSIVKYPMQDFRFSWWWWLWRVPFSGVCCVIVG